MKRIFINDFYDEVEIFILFPVILANQLPFGNSKFYPLSS